jgi:hypothetical protein
MTDESARSKTVFAYIGYATANQIWSEIKTGLLVVAVVGGIMALFTLGIDSVIKGASAAPNLGLPKWFWWTVAACIALWSLRGQTIHIPKITFKEWLLVSTVLLILAFVGTMVPDWALSFLYGAAGMAVYVVETLNEHGNKNYALLKGSSSDSDSRNDES